LENDRTQQTQRTFARANLLQTCYGLAMGKLLYYLMDFGLYQAHVKSSHSCRIVPYLTNHSSTVVIPDLPLVTTYFTKGTSPLARLADEL